MPIVVLVLALLAYAYALIAAPGFRRWGLLLGAAVGLGLAVYFWQTSPETARNAQRIDASELILDQLAYETTQRGATVTGRVTNGSEAFRLREMTIALRLHDCPEAEIPIAECPVIGQSRAIARPDAPPGQIRAFTAHFMFSNVPAVAGILRWDWDIVETRATTN
jgi:hypothetical protein